MSGYGSIKKATHEAAQPAAPQRDPKLCHADHCPCMGSVSLEGGHFLCTAHACVPADQWGRVTESLHEHRWLIEFIDELPRIEKARVKDGPGWREFARAFWNDTDQVKECLPHDLEEMLPYQNRMRGELLYRCHLAKRPAPRLPQQAKGRGNAARFLTGGVA